MTDHDHEEFDLPDGDPLGRPVNNALLGQFIGAGFDGCTSCQDAQLTLIVEDAATTARLVELACVSTHSILGGLPDNLIDPSVPGMASPEFRQLARAGLDGANTAMWTMCEQMSPTQRRAAANTAADIFIGHLSLG